ncbi:Ubiquitin carboxyl-terminal hydrolase 47 [Nymphon striatum]|nr:Ubiquitin carboxyl-terminal hydrolase 47 [Nymphon striatum]
MSHSWISETREAVFSECNSDDCDTTDSGSALDYDTNSNHGNSISNIDVTQEDDEGIDVDDGRQVGESHMGPYQYELFSIMIHSGSASGGHYYAYVKSFKDGQWYSFNDQEVTSITIDDIKRTYGGGPTYSSYASSTNAYMLIYRQIDKDLNKFFMKPDSFPEHLQALQQGMLEQEERDRVQKEIYKSYYKIKLYCNHPTKKRMVDTCLHIHKDISLSDATEMAHEILLLNGVIPLEQCRLVKYDGLNDSLICSFEDCMDQSIGELVGNNKFDLLLETRPPDKEFECYKAGGTSVKVNVINLESEAIQITKSVRGYLTQTIGEFKELIAKELELPSEEMRLVLDKGCTDMKPLVIPERTLKDEGFYYTSKVFVECSGSEDSEKPFESSKFHKILERYSHTICIYVTLPKVDKDTLERLSIPRYDENTSQNNVVDINNAAKKPVPLYISPEMEEGSSTENYDPLDDMSNLNVHSDQSEDSSLTDSDRTLIGDEISPRNNSPEPSACNPSCLVNSLSEIELMSASMRNSSASNSPQDELCEDDRNLSSPEENSRFHKSSSGTMNWVYTTIDCNYGMSSYNYNSTPSPLCEDVKRYFRAWPFNDTETDEKMLRVYVDKRITVGALKKDFEPYVGVPMEHFKVYRVYSNHQELECSRLSENLMSYGEDCKLVIKLGRALKKGEHKVKIFQFLPNDSEPIKYLMDWIFYNGMTVLEAKKQLIPELKENFNIDVPISRYRLRKKSWKNPSTIFLDTLKFDHDISIYSNWEIFVEILSEDEQFNNSKAIAIFTRRWRSSLFKLDPIVEVLLDSTSFADLKTKISEISGIEESNVEFAKAQGTYPCDHSLLTISKELEWHSRSTSLGAWPLYISDDGFVVYYRDKSEIEKELTEEEKKELSNKGSPKLAKASRTYSPRKEKALKIYMDTSPSTTNSRNGTTAS